MNAVILATGDELVLGQNVDTNSAWLSERLASHGVMTLYHKTVGDDLDAITNALDEAARAAELVILTGGLGPTRTISRAKRLPAFSARRSSCMRPRLNESACSPEDRSTDG